VQQRKLTGGCLPASASSRASSRPQPRCRSPSWALQERSGTARRHRRPPAAHLDRHALRRLIGAERHRRRSTDGAWARSLTAAQADADADAAGGLDRLVAADSSLMRVHQHGATAPRIGGAAATVAGPSRTLPELAGAGRVSQGAGSNDKKSGTDPPDHAGGVRVTEPDDHTIGRARGGLTTKLRPLTDGVGRPLALASTAGNVDDTAPFAQLLDGVRVPRNGPGWPRTRRTTWWPTRTTALGPAVNGGAAAGSPTPSPSPPTKPGSDIARAAPMAGRSGSQGPPPASQRRRARLLPARTVARAGHPLRQARPHPPRRGHLRRPSGLTPRIQQTRPDGRRTCAGRSMIDPWKAAGPSGAGRRVRAAPRA